ncbi:uncharacterized protein A4U43_C06F18480 [Asparagus officinalis]|uniref:Uncharacterized protein n=1 Tax=Asparagus officinalis TaxID=4686 RepID=A0A5P1EMP8_ASPOF|nr:uncharacterized protein LOC109846376 isoform X2 [Asparagus officinalis]XP_020271193.1 uncharacterized protein LOC109846376 isoform X2 [Asparagus officinalis]XP_020271194.1 uncharacterized protein LOC109846376 isoform X2 [Asparagus officinalis]XP_020271195.1 uncharacterized protein LOC109846376 isoform X2 [Asparagus officinalis]XP_020271196.1 uncharacterized protein LOC109846376 isoform X2 [Asparagus officinalis]XP_020271197.1 uncharacterized protein LOC109846376 isoform X2 [Asparagus offici
MIEEGLIWSKGTPSFSLGPLASCIGLFFVLVIILEIRSRAMKAKAKPKDYLFSDNLHWFIAPNETKEKGDNNDGDVQSEVFYSVKSCFSRCSSEKENDILSHFRRRNSIWEEFLHCEGWPFGLSRKALMLPPLPRSPPDSWTWSKRNTGTKFCAAT